MITLSDDEEIEEEAETEANLIYHVTVYHVKNMFTVLITWASSNSALGSLVDQLVEMVVKPTSFTG